MAARGTALVVPEGMAVLRGPGGWSESMPTLFGMALRTAASMGQIVPVGVASPARSEDAPGLAEWWTRWYGTKPVAVPAGVGPVRFLAGSGRLAEARMYADADPEACLAAAEASLGRAGPPLEVLTLEADCPAMDRLVELARSDRVVCGVCEPLGPGREPGGMGSGRSGR